MSVEVRWVHPSDLTSNYDKSKITRAGNEDGPYAVLTEIETFDSNGNANLTFVDQTGTLQNFYVIRYRDSTTGLEFSDFSLGYFPFTPKEKRIVSFIGGWVPEVFKPDITDFDIRFSLNLALNDFNVYPPATSFTLGSFPTSYEQFLVAGTQIHIMRQKFLKVAIRDYTGSDSGLTLAIDRGAKIKTAEDQLMVDYRAVISMAKWNFQCQGVGLGTVPLPVSVGTSLNRGLLNVLDIFNAMGR